MKEKARVENALHATRAAVEEGIVPGGGVALIRALAAIEKINGLSDEQAVGVAIIRRACKEPCRQIATNAGKEGSIIVQGVRQGKGGHGYNAQTDKFEDLYVCLTKMLARVRLTPSNMRFPSKNLVRYRGRNYSLGLLVGLGVACSTNGSSLQVGSGSGGAGAGQKDGPGADVRRIGHRRRYLCGGPLLLSDLRLHGTVPRTVLPRGPVGVSALRERACRGNARRVLPSGRRHRSDGVCGRHHPVLTAPWRHAMRPCGRRARLIGMPVS